MQKPRGGKEAETLLRLHGVHLEIDSFRGFLLHYCPIRLAGEALLCSDAQTRLAKYTVMFQADLSNADGWRMWELSLSLS